MHGHQVRQYKLDKFLFMKKTVVLFVIILLVQSCRVTDFAVNENGRIYSCAQVGTVIVDSSMRVGNTVKITVIGKRGQYSYEIIDSEGKIIKSGKY